MRKMKTMKTRFLGLMAAAVMIFSVSEPIEAGQVVTSDGSAVVMDIEESTNPDAETIQEDLKLADSSEMLFPKEIKIHTGNDGSYLYSVYNMPSNGKIQNVKISDSKIATVAARPDGIEVKAKKAGAATVKFTVKYGTKKKNFTAKLTVYKYSNPVKSFKLGGKEIKASYNKGTSYYLTLKKAQKVKFNVKAKAGWKITSFTYYCNGASKRYNTNSPTIKLKKAAGSSVQINFTNEKTGLIENLVVWIRV